MRRLFAGLLAILFCLPFFLCRAEADGKKGSLLLNDRCTLEWNGFCNYPKRLTDYDCKSGTASEKGGSAAIYWTEDVPVGLMYWEWTVPPEECSFTFLDENKQPLSTSLRYRDGDVGYLYVPEEARGVRLEIKDRFRMTEWHLYEKDRLPDSIHLWEQAPDKCDIMLVSAHSDDELVMMGGIVPTYAGERGLRVQVVYCYVPVVLDRNKSGSRSEEERHAEALEGLWFSGMRTLPVFFFIEQENRYRFDEKITREIRRFKPEVVITHDPKGEYGNEGHKLVSKKCTEAVAAAADPTKFPASAEEYGTWEVKKYYLHLYKENQIVLDFDTPLSAFDGKTAFEMAQEAYAFHKSQRKDWLDVLKSNQYDCRKYGLYSSTVGPDVEKNDFLENIPPELLSNYTAPTPAPTEEPTPEPTPEPTEEPTAEPTEEPTPEPTEEPTPEPTAEPAEAPTEQPTEASAATPAPAPQPEPNAFSVPSEWLLLGGIALLLLILAAALVIVRIVRMKRD